MPEIDDTDIYLTLFEPEAIRKMLNEYKPCRSKHKGTTYTDEATICPACGDECTLNELVEELPIGNTDGEKHTYVCRQCGTTLEITMMIALWRTAVRQLPPGFPVLTPVRTKCVVPKEPEDEPLGPE